jgi:hypothetical protein
LGDGSCDGRRFEAFSQIRKSNGRASILRYVGKFSRENEVVFGMGIVAVQDRSYAVRHYGCALLAYSLRDDALPALSVLLNHPDRRKAADAHAAMDAIKGKSLLFHGQGPQRQNSLGLRINLNNSSCRVKLLTDGL